MRLSVCAFALGVCVLQLFPELPSSAIIRGGFAVSVVGAAMLLWSPLAPSLRMLAALTLALAVGFFWAAWRADQRLLHQLAPSLEGRDIHVTGVIAGLPQLHERGVRFAFDIEGSDEGVGLPDRIQLNWYGRFDEEDERPATVPPLKAGERWILTVRLKRPRGTANPHGFDYELWLLEQGVGATGYARKDPGNRRVDRFVWRFDYAVERLREAIRDRMQGMLADRPYAGVLIALAVGDQRAIPSTQWQVFTRTGVNHLMSISGLHITMVGGLVAALTGFAWRRTRWSLRIPALKAAAVAGFGAALAYALLAGFAVPAQRTVLMLGVVAFAMLRGVEIAPSTVLALALFVVVLFDPWAVTAAGFWLSFGAVAVILYVSAGRIGPAHWLTAWGRVQWAVTLGTVPLLLALFQQVSIASPIANAVAIPVIGLIVVPLALLGCMPPLGFLLLVADSIVGLCMWFLEFLSSSSAAVWESHAPQPWTVALALCGVVWLLLPRGFPARWLGLVAFIPLFAARPELPGEGDLRLTVLDVGQGLAVVAQTRHHALLYDAGPDFGGDADAGNRIVVPFLRAAGVTHLDGLVLSHNDLDHIGGAASVVQSVPIGWLASSLPQGHELGSAVARSFRCFDGQHWEWDGVRFEMLGPEWSDTPRGLRDNDRSCVLKIVTASGSVLIPGDIEKRAELALVARAADRVATTLLIAPHHGSRTSSSEALLDVVQPRVVAFTAGYRNRFGHPKEEVVARYGGRNVEILRSDRDGALLVDFSGGTMHLERWREKHRRYWQTDVGSSFRASSDVK